jgi:hypothetical protein
MFILYAIPFGIVLGYLLGGRLDGLAGLRLRWAPLALLGLAVQIALFTDVVGSRVGGAAPAIYVASTAGVFVAVLRNLSIPGVALIAAGAGCNLAAIVANGGYMPASPAAIATVGGFSPGYTNSIVVEQPALRPLTDLFALPAWMPFANVFSLGDVLIGIGIVATIALAMHGRRASAPGSGVG